MPPVQGDVTKLLNDSTKTGIFRPADRNAEKGKTYYGKAHAIRMLRTRQEGIYIQKTAVLSREFILPNICSHLNICSKSHKHVKASMIINGHSS